MWSNYLWESRILPWFFFFLLLLLAYSATNSTISSKTVESYYFYSSCFSILGHVFKCVKWMLAALEFGMIQPSPSTGCSHCKGWWWDKSSSPTQSSSPECHSPCFPSWSFITHQMQCLRKASQAIIPIPCAVGPTSFHIYSRKGTMPGAWSTIPDLDVEQQ